MTDAYTRQQGVDLFSACDNLHYRYAEGQTACAWGSGEYPPVIGWSLTAWSADGLTEVIQFLEPDTNYRITNCRGSVVVDSEGAAWLYPANGADRRPLNENGLQNHIEMMTELVPYPTVDSLWVYSEDGQADALVSVARFGKTRFEPQLHVTVRLAESVNQVANKLKGLSTKGFWDLVAEGHLFPATHAITKAATQSRQLLRIEDPRIRPAAVVVGDEFTITVVHSYGSLRAEKAVLFPYGAIFLDLGDIIELSTHGSNPEVVVPLQDAVDWVPALKSILFLVPNPMGGPMVQPPTYGDH